MTFYKVNFKTFSFMMIELMIIESFYHFEVAGSRSNNLDKNNVKTLTYHKRTEQKDNFF